MKRTIIIAEAGVNHNGDLSIAKMLIKTAKECGADIVKFQTANPKALVTAKAPMAEYQKKNLGSRETQRDMLERIFIPQDAFVELSEYCTQIGIKFLSSPFDIGCIRFLDKLQNMWKVPSGEITNYPFLVEMAKTGKDIFLSTGMSTMEEVKTAIEVLRDNGAGKITLLHCTTNYPTPVEDVNLNAMLAMKNQCNCPIGYSDHTKGIEVAIAAVALGAEVIEKHFTLDRNMEGPDHKASLEPNELEAMIKAIRNIENAMGDGEKIPSQSEKINMGVVRKSIIAARHINKGEVFTENNITTKRPGTGINPMKWNDIIGMQAKRDFEEDEFIEI